MLMGAIPAKATSSVEQQLPDQQLLEFLGLFDDGDLDGVDPVVLLRLEEELAPETEQEAGNDN
jgi:hypothetical protein